MAGPTASVQPGRLPGGHDALRVVGGRVTRYAELDVITLLQLRVRDVLQLRAVEEEVLRPLAGLDEAPAFLALPMHLLHLHDALQIDVWRHTELLQNAQGKGARNPISTTGQAGQQL